MEKTMRVAEQIRLLKVIGGIAWIAAGVFGCFENIICSIFQILALLVSITNIIRVSISKKEYPDEMANENLCKAKAQTLDIMHIIFCAVDIVAILALGRNNISLNWAKVIPVTFFFVLGIENLSVGITFHKLEAD